MVERLGKLDGRRDERVAEDAVLPDAAEDGAVEARVAQDSGQPSRHLGYLGVVGYRLAFEQLLRP